MISKKKKNLLRICSQIRRFTIVATKSALFSAITSLCIFRRHFQIINMQIGYFSNINLNLNDSTFAERGCEWKTANKSKALLFISVWDSNSPSLSLSLSLSRSFSHSFSHVMREHRTVPCVTLMLFQFHLRFTFPNPLSSFSITSTCIIVVCVCVFFLFGPSCRRIDIKVLGNCFSLPIFHYIRALKTTLLHYFTWWFSGPWCWDAIWKTVVKCSMHGNGYRCQLIFFFSFIHFIHLKLWCAKWKDYFLLFNAAVCVPMRVRAQ